MDLLAHASSVARITGQLDDVERLNGVEPLSDHVGALVRGLADLLRHDRPTDTIEDDDNNASAVDELRQLIARADALASTTDQQLGLLISAPEDGDRSGFNRLAHLVEMTAAAADASAKVIAVVERGLPSDHS